jgi:hypothetical protein
MSTNYRSLLSILVLLLRACMNGGKWFLTKPFRKTKPPERQSIERHCAGRRDQLLADAEVDPRISRGILPRLGRFLAPFAEHIQRREQASHRSTHSEVVRPLPACVAWLLGRWTSSAGQPARRVRPVISLASARLLSPHCPCPWLRRSRSWPGGGRRRVAFIQPVALLAQVASLAPRQLPRPTDCG